MDGLFTTRMLYLIPMMAAATISLKAFGKSWHSAFRTFALFLIISLAGELLAVTWARGLHQTSYWHFAPNNHWIYGPLNMVRCLLLLSYFSAFAEREKSQRTFRFVMILVLLLSLFNYAFLQTPFLFNTHSIILQNAVIIGVVIWFFRKVMMADQPIVLSKSPAFWIAFGTFIFYCGSTPIFLSLNYLNIVDLQLSDSLYIIIDLLNYLLYTSYAIAFLCKPKLLI